MNLDQINDAPDILMEFLEYHSTVRGHSDKTIAGYYLDLKILFRYLKRRRGLVSPGTPFNEIDITDIDIDFIKKYALRNFTDISLFRRKCRIHPMRSLLPAAAAGLPL